MRSEVRGERDGATFAGGPYYQQWVTVAIGDDGATGFGDDSVVTEKMGPFFRCPAKDRMIGNFDAWCYTLGDFDPIVVVEHVDRENRRERTHPEAGSPVNPAERHVASDHDQPASALDVVGQHAQPIRRPLGSQEGLVA